MPEKKKSYAEFSFGPAFQEEMLALMIKDLSLAVKAVKHIPKERLYSEAHQYLFDRIAYRVGESGMTPTAVEIEDHLKTVEKHRRRMLKTFCDRIFAMEVKSEQFIKDKLTDYAKRSAFIDIFQGAQTLYNTKMQTEAYEHVMKGIGELYTINFKEDAAITIGQFEEIRQIYLHSMATSTRRIPTNIEPLDEILRGGLEKGELGILVAEPKKGKSIGLVHMGSAALMMRRGRVAHFVLEGTTEQAVLRYQTRLTEILYRDLEGDTLTAAQRAKLQGLATRYTNRLDLIPMNQHWTYTALDVESKIKELKRAGREPDLVIIDYGDLLKHHEPTDNSRMEQTEVFRALKRIAMMQSVAIWTASQARRPADNDKEYILRSRDIAECFEKVRIADLVCTLNQTQRERRHGIMRFCVDIYRSADTDKIIRLVQDYERMIFYSKRLGHISKDEAPSWKKDS
jgi:replicative DNA helicase